MKKLIYAALLSIFVAFMLLHFDVGLWEGWSESGSTDKIIQKYTKKIEKNSRDAAAYNRRGEAYAGRGNGIQAKRDFEKAIEIDPLYAEAYLNRGKMSQEREAAIADFNRAIEIDPNLAEAYYYRGINRYKSDGEGAIKDFEKTLKIDPKNTDAYFSLGRYYRYKKSDESRYLEYLDKIIEVDPRDAYVYNERGMVYMRKGDYERAVSDLDKAVKIDPNNMQAQIDRLVFCWHIGKSGLKRANLDCVITICNRVIRNDPWNSLAYMCLYFAHEMKGNADSAKNDQIMSTLIYFYDNRYVSYNFGGARYEGSEDWAEEDKIVKEFPGRRFIYVYRASRLYGSGRYQEAIALLTRTINFEKMNPYLRNYRGMSHRRNGDYEEALADFNKALEINPNYEEAYLNKGLTYDDMGLHSRAAADYRRVISSYDRQFKGFNINRRVYVNRGTACLRTGEYDLAIADFDEILSSAPDSIENYTEYTIYFDMYNNRAEAWYRKGDYDKAWDDIDKCIKLGGNPSPELIRDLEKSTGKKLGK